MAAARPLTEAAVVHFLHPGDVAFAQRGERLETLLGSCVAVILTDPRRTVGAMCHIVHSGGTPAGAARDTTHAAPALAALFAELNARGINPRLCQAFVFGGGNMFPRQFAHTHVGQGNAQWALGALAQQGIAVVGQDLGGARYRRIGWTVGPEPPQVAAVAV
jgi:chemotaxis protein CheD